MNKTELIEKVAAKTGVSKKEAGELVAATFETIEAELVAGGKVQLIGFGTFETRARAARTGKNPRTREQVAIAACKAPVFKAGAALKEAVNK